jgi:NADPH:quinone reductase-like Zn-dependent oxidoreductase
VVGVAGMGLGCHARYRCLNADAALIAKPAGLFHEAAVAALFGGMTALDYLRRARLGEGEDLLVVGASGAVGSAAVQLAAHLGARVTAVCSTRNGAWVTELGAKRWFDYTRQTWPGPSDAFDVVLDATGTVDWRRARPWLRPKGRFLALAGGLPDVLRVPWVAATSQQRIIAGPAGEYADDIRMLMQRMSEGTFRPHVDGVYPLERIRDAHRHVDTGHKRGSVVVTM